MVCREKWANSFTRSEQILTSSSRRRGTRKSFGEHRFDTKGRKKTDLVKINTEGWAKYGKLNLSTFGRNVSCRTTELLVLMFGKTGHECPLEHRSALFPKRNSSLHTKYTLHKKIRSSVGGHWNSLPFRDQ